MFRISLKRLLMVVCAWTMTSMAWAQGASGDIFVSADVEGVPVLIDGEETGERTPAMLKGVPLGTHEVAIETECGRDTAAVTVTDGRIARADLKAPTGQGTLRVLPDPVDAQIYLDGEQVLGKEPFASLDCGMHRVEVRASQYAAQVREIRVEAGAHHDLAIMLQKDVAGTLVLEVYPLNARILVDGVEVSVGPVTIEPISAGQHVVMVEADGYFQHTEVVEVNETGVQRVSIELTSESGEKASAPVVVAESTRSGSAMVDRPTVSEPVGGGSTDKMDGASRSQSTSLPTASPGSASAPPVAREPISVGKRVGLGMTVLGLGAGIYAGYNYKISVDAYDRYVNIDDDDRARDIWNDELVPAQQRVVVSSVVGGVSLLTGAIVWVKSPAPTNASVQLGVGLQRVELRGQW